MMPRSLHLIVSLVLLACFSATRTLGFSSKMRSRTQISRSSSYHSYVVSTHTQSALFAGGEENYSDLPPPEESAEYTGSIDWDAEWKKVVANEGKLVGQKERPGQGYYKSEAEIQAIKAANEASKKLAEAGNSVTNSLPDVRSLSGDWRFWIAILALVSVGLSVLTAPPSISTGLQGDSYYI
jgi:hypothetical protein